MAVARAALRKHGLPAVKKSVVFATNEPEIFANKEAEMKSTAHIDEEIHGKVMEVALHGKLGREDYYMFAPEAERMIEKHGKIRILITMHDFDGWKPGALWEDIKWNTRHFSHIERMAVVGEKTWHRMLTGFYKPFTNAEVRYFTPEQLDAARAWIHEPTEFWDGTESGSMTQP